MQKFKALANLPWVEERVREKKKERSYMPEERYYVPEECHYMTKEPGYMQEAWLHAGERTYMTK
jgi:hypothetical protein